MKAIKLTAIGICLAVMAILLFDSIGSDTKSLRFLGIHSSTLVIPTLLLITIYRIKFGRLITGKLSGGLFFSSLCLLLIGSVLAIAESVTPLNVVYSITRMHPIQLIISAIFSGSLFIINQSSIWWEKHFHTVIFLLPLVFFYILYLISLLPFNVFKEVVKEDHIIENLQFFVLLAGSIISLIRGWLARVNKNKLLPIFFIAASLGSFLLLVMKYPGGKGCWALKLPKPLNQSIVKRKPPFTISILLNG